MNKYINIIAIILLLFSCGKKQEETSTEEGAQKLVAISLSTEQKQNAGVSYGELIEQVIPVEIKVTGFVDVPPIAAASVSVPIGGYIKTTHEVLPGKKVAAGEVLATIASLDLLIKVLKMLVVKTLLRQV